MLLRFDPFAEFDRLTPDLPQAVRRTAMPADAYRIGDRMHVHFDLPDIDPEASDITVEKNTLTITAERSWAPSDEAAVIMSERPQGTFMR